MDAVQKANSGHPGAPMALAPVAYLLYTKVDEAQPGEPALVRPRPLRALGRARLDAPLLDAPPERLRRVDGGPRELPPARQPHRGPPRVRGRRRARRGGHDRPARPGRRATRWASRWPSGCWPPASTARPEIVDHHTYAIASDGDMQEGVASEASSLAGHLGLGRLMVFYDDNKIQLAGETKMAFSEDVGQALRGLRLARPEPRRGHRAGPHRGRDRGGPRGGGPARRSMILRTHIGFGSPEQAGQPEGPRLAARRGRGAPDEGGLRLGPGRALPRPGRGARALRARSLERGARRRPSGTSGSTPTARRAPSSAAELELFMERPAAGRLELRPAALQPDDEPVATRKASNEVIQWAAGELPDAREWLGGPEPLHAHRDRRRRLGHARRLLRAQHPLRRPRARHGRDRQRPRPARACGPSDPRSSTSSTT